MLIANLLEARQIFFRRDQYAVRSDNRFNDDRGNIAFVFDHVVEVLHTGNPALRIRVMKRTAVTVDLGTEDNARNFPGRFHRPSARIAGGGD